MNVSGLSTLVVDDEPNIRYFLRVTLEKAGHTVVEAENGAHALELIRETNFDVIILDLNLGGKIDGLRVMEGIRWRWPESIVIILTGHGTFESSLTAIQEGVDGYLLKPVDDRELLQTIEDVLRRIRLRGEKSQSTSATLLTYGPMQLDPADCHLSIGSQSISLTLNEYHIMRYLISNPNRVVPARELVYVVHQHSPETEVEAREVIKWYIHRLRKKIEPDTKHPRYLLNIRGIGYRLGS